MAHSIPAVGAALLWTSVHDVLGSSKDGAALPGHPSSEGGLPLSGMGMAGQRKRAKHMAEDWGDEQDAHLGSHLDLVWFILVMNWHSDILSGNSAPFRALPLCQLQDVLLESNFILFNVATFLIALLFCETIPYFIMQTVH